jgi:hypothetical protein
VKEHPDEFAELKKTWGLRKSGNPWHSSNKPSDLEAGCQALDKALQHVAVVCATPDSIAEISEHTKWKPSLIIVDDAHLMTEAMALLPVSIYPDVPALFLGDVSQGGSVAKVSKDETYNALFTKQPELSYIQRLTNAGLIDSTVASSHEADSGNDPAASTNLVEQNDVTPQTEISGNSTNLAEVAEQVERMNLSGNIVQPDDAPITVTGQPDNDLTGSDDDQALMGKANHQAIP